MMKTLGVQDSSMGRTYKYEKSWGKPKKPKRTPKQVSPKGEHPIPKHTSRPDDNYNYQESFERFDKKR